MYTFANVFIYMSSRVGRTALLAGSASWVLICIAVLFYKQKNGRKLAKTGCKLSDGAKTAKSNRVNRKKLILSSADIDILPFVQGNEYEPIVNIRSPPRNTNYCSYCCIKH